MINVFEERDVLRDFLSISLPPSVSAAAHRPPLFFLTPPLEKEIGQR